MIIFLLLPNLLAPRKELGPKFQNSSSFQHSGNLHINQRTFSFVQIRSQDPMDDFQLNYD